MVDEPEALNEVNPIVENNVEDIVIGNFVAAKYDSINYIVKIFELNGQEVKGSFLRPAETKQFNGFVYKYPQIEDIASFPISGNLMKPAKPKIYLRSMFIFFDLYISRLERL